MYIDNAQRWVHWMNRGWGKAPRIARQINKVLKKHRVPGRRLLELGCGNGRIAIHMARLGYDVTGVDFSRAFLDQAEKRAARDRLRMHFVHGDVRKVDRLVRDRFDAAISIWTSLGYYDKRTDQMIFSKVARRLKQGGLFLILFTMSRERLINIFSPRQIEETDQYLALIENTYDNFRSMLNNRWIFYKKQGRDFVYEDEVDCRLRIYALHEFVEMAENAGMKLKATYDSIMTLAPATPISFANLVFQKR